MNNVPSCCYSICGAVFLVSLTLLLGFINTVRQAPTHDDWDYRHD